MTEIERKALALVNEVRDARQLPQFFGYEEARRELPIAVAVAVLAIEQHEAFRQEVSDAVAPLLREWPEIRSHIVERLSAFIIAKRDPLVEALNDMKDGRAGPTTESYAACLRAAIEKRGGKIVWGEGQ